MEDEEMWQIFNVMADSKHFKVDPEVRPIFDDIIKKERRSESFGNARTVRNVLDHVIDKHSVNVVRKRYADEDRYIIHSQDFEKIRLGSIGAFAEFDEDLNPLVDPSIVTIEGVVSTSELESHIFEGVVDWRGTWYPTGEYFKCRYNESCRSHS